VEAKANRYASVDFVGADKGNDGNDLATTLGSNLTFTAQSASISNGDQIEIVEQTFGFDTKGGTTKIELDLTQGNYWMKVRKSSNG